MSLEEALNSVENFYQRIYWQAPGVITHSTPGYTLSYSGINWMHSLNQLWLHRTEALDDRLLASAAAFFGRYDAEHCVVFTADEPSETATWLSERHYMERASSPIYRLNGIPRPQHLNREAQIILAQPEHQDELLSVLYRTFFMGPEIGRCIVRPEHFTDPTIRHYLAYMQGELAGCATFLLNDSIAGVWNVATLRAFRRQGVASALLMRGLVDAAALGCADSVLMASPMGRAIYEEMGYLLVGTTYFYGAI